MPIRTGTILLLLCAGFLALGAAAPTPVYADDFDRGAVREKVGPSVCFVTAQNGFGLPLARATGFVMGQGQFVVTDLAALARPGVSQAVVRFQDGSTVVARRFGMADAVLGLAVIRLEEGAPKVRGLLLLSQRAELDLGATAAALGWEWGEKLEMAVGSLTEGPEAADLAGRVETAPPATDLAFLAFDGPDLGGASGSPVVDGTGRVLGVWLDVADPGGANIVVPAPALRQALLSKRPELSPLADLPKPFWPVRILRLQGKPVSGSQFAAAARGLKSRMKCQQCKGSGSIIVSRVIGTYVVGGIRKQRIRREAADCPTCHGEGIVFREGMYAQLAKMAELGTRLRFDPALDQRTAAAARTTAIETIEALARVGRRFRDDLTGAGAADLANSKASVPRGVLLYVQVRETFNGPDGSYTVLAPHLSSRFLAIRSGARDDGAAGSEAHPAPRWPYGKWIVLAGLAETRFKVGGRQYVYVWPLASVPGPYLGRAPPRPPPNPWEPGGEPPLKPVGPEEDTKGPPPPEKEEGDPDFFGL